MVKRILKIIKFIPLLIAIYYRLFIQGFIFHWTALNATLEILSYIIFGIIWLDFWEIIEIISRDTMLLIRKKRPELIKKLKIDLTYQLPRKLINFAFVIILSFIIYKWFTSSPIIIAISAWVFKQINQDISHLIVLSILYIFKKPQLFPKDEYTKICKTTPNYMTSAMYIPQKSSFLSDATWGINQSLRSFKNNLTENQDIIQNNYLIYHSDTTEKEIKSQEIKDIFNAWKLHGNKIFMFSRDNNSYAKNFLWKPGAYMSDYQILTTGITHPLTYTSKCFDTRRQLKIKLDGRNNIIYQNNHVPFCCDLDKNKILRQENAYDYFLKYFPKSITDKKNLFLKVKLTLTKLGQEFHAENNKICISENGDLIDVDTKKVLAKKGTFCKDKLERYSKIETIQENVKFTNLHFLVDINNPNHRLKIHLGSLFNGNNFLIAQSDQWKIDNHGNVNYFLDKTTKNIYGQTLPRKAIHVFVQKISFLNKILNIDKNSNLIDDATGDIWAKSEKYNLNFSFDLYQKNDGKFELVQKNYIPDKTRLQGEDFRRLPTDNFNRIPLSCLQELIDEKELTKEEAVNISSKGIIGDLYSLNVGKNGWENEYYVEDSFFKHKLKVIGGYIVKKSDGYFIDNEKCLCKQSDEKPYRVTPETKAYELKKIQKGNDFFLILTYENKNDHNFEYIREPKNRKKIKCHLNEKYLFVKNKYFDFIKPTKEGYVVNEKDGFILDASMNLWHIHITNNKLQKTLIANKENIKFLSKQKIFVDYSKDANLIKRDYIAPAGSWYTDSKGNYRKRKHLGILDFCFFNQNLDINYFDPVSKECKIFSSGSYCLTKDHVYAKDTFPTDEIIKENNIRQYQNNLVKDTILAKKSEYQILDNGFVELKNKDFLPYGIFLVKDNTYLKNPKGYPLPADVKINIVNQTDADTEFMPYTVSNLNSILIRNIQENPDPYLMLQPEISYGNAGASTFAKISAWAQEMYKFADQTLFAIFGRSTAYGKMTKLLDAYTENITFKEAIPPIARTHDHWEAMKLKTALIKSNPRKKINTLLENVPPSFRLYLKRQMEWLSGDLILLELETRFGKLLDFLRAIKWVVKRQVKEAKYWFFHAFSEKRMIGYASTPSISQRLESIKRTSFNPFLFGTWILIIGFTASIFPGSLSIGAPKIAWGLFWTIIIGLIILPKFIMPTIETIKKYFSHIARFIFFISNILIGVGIGKYAILYFENLYINIMYYFFLWLFAGIIIIKPLLIIAFGRYRKMKYRIVSLFSLILIILLGIFYLPDLIYKLDCIPSARWIPFLLYIILPKITAYLLPILILMSLTNYGRKILNSLRKGLLEAIYSTSLLLMMVIYTTIGLYKKIKFMVNQPHTAFVWTPAEIYKYTTRQFTLFNMYYMLIAAPLVSLIVIILPVSTGLADYSLIFYGWPIFLWSWLLGPLLAYLTEKYGRSKYYNDLLYLAIREKLTEWIRDYQKENKNFPDSSKTVRTILSLTSRYDIYTFIKRLKLYIHYLLSNIIGEQKLISYQHVNILIEKNLKKQNLPIDRIREYNWQTCGEIDRAKYTLKVVKQNKIKSIPDEIKLLKAVLMLLLKIGNSRPGVASWNDFKLQKKKKNIKSVLFKCRLAKRKEITKSSYYKDLINLTS